MRDLGILVSKGDLGTHPSRMQGQPYSCIVRAPSAWALPPQPSVARPWPTAVGLPKFPVRALSERRAHAWVSEQKVRTQQRGLEHESQSDSESPQAFIQTLIQCRKSVKGPCRWCGSPPPLGPPLPPHAHPTLRPLVATFCSSVTLTWVPGENSCPNDFLKPQKGALGPKWSVQDP